MAVNAHVLSDENDTHTDLPPPLSFSEDCPLLNDCKPVIWIEKNDKRVVKSILAELLRSPEIKKECEKSLVCITSRYSGKHWIQFYNECKLLYQWNVFEPTNYIGCESDVVVVDGEVAAIGGYINAFSRARRFLVIIAGLKYFPFKTLLGSNTFTYYYESGGSIMRADDLVLGSKNPNGKRICDLNDEYNRELLSE